MLCYIISDRKEIGVEKDAFEISTFFTKKDLKTFNVDEYEIFSFDVLCKTSLNIFVVENNKILYKNEIVFNACMHGHVKVLEWFKNSKYEFKYDNDTIICVCLFKNIKILEWFKKLNVKKVIKWSEPLKYIKTIKYKTKNNYIKGYSKN